MAVHPYTRLFSKVSAPTTGDDNTLGYEIGDQWITATKIYICRDTSTGAAVWVDLSVSGFTQEQIEDFVGAMVSSNTETGIAVTYDDAGGKLNFDAQTAGDARYAPIAKGVTNGDSHDHVGGDGGTVAYTSISGTPTIREALTADRTYYVRTDGSDSNNGLANTAGGAFLTIQKAYDTIVTLDLRGYVATIQIADGTYTGRLNITTPPLGGNVTVNGNSGTPANVVLSVTSNDAITMDAPFTLTVQNFKVTTTTGGNCITCGNGKVVIGVGMNFGACAAEHMRALNGGRIYNSANNYTISGAATRHMAAILNGIFEFASSTITVSGTPAITEFVLAGSGGIISAFSLTYSGSATGTRYNANMNGAIQTYGGGANYFPGNVAGTTGTGGQYA